MSNLSRVLRKEFVDLVSSPMVLIILVGFFIMITLSFVNLNNMLPVIIQTGIGTRNEHVNNIGLFFADWLFLNLIGFYGPIVGVMIGCSSIASERHRYALNTLLTKPLYRDTIINGKMLGSLAFLALVVAGAIALYTSLVLVLHGNLIAPEFGDYVSRLPVVFAFALTAMAIFVSLSMLVSLLISNQTFSLIVSSLIVYLFYNLEGYARVIGNLFQGKELVVQDFIVGLTPIGGLLSIRNNVFNGSYGPVEALGAVLPDLAKFLLYVVVACVFSYILFLRRDEA